MSLAEMSILSERDAEGVLQDHYGLKATAAEMGSYIDQNFLVRVDDGRKLVLKIQNPAEQLDTIEFQNEMMQHLGLPSPGITCSRPLPNLRGETITVLHDSGRKDRRLVRLLTYLEGSFWADQKEQNEDLLEKIGAFFGNVDTRLQSFDHRGARRDLNWDVKNAARAAFLSVNIADHRRRALVESFLLLFEVEAEPKLRTLRRSVIHGDGNDYNVLVGRGEAGTTEVRGLIDFGDAVYTHTVCEVAIVAAYAAMHLADPLSAMAAVVRGYHRVHPLQEEEVEILYYLIAARLCFSVISSATQITEDPDNAYLTISEKPAWSVLEQLASVNPLAGENAFRQACGFPLSRPSMESARSQRRRHLGPSLSVAYDEPIRMVGGRGQYMFDDRGNSYLDLVNNVSHVGHSHPTVVKAAVAQMARLNTNTRYLHDGILRYAARLTATLPAPLEVCYFVCSGSEANELALRLARTYTARRDVVVVDGAYHGNTSSLIDISPYKFAGVGGRGKPEYVHVVPPADLYRGPYKKSDPLAAHKYAVHVKEALNQAEAAGSPAAMFMVESLLGCGGQIPLPAEYLCEAQRYVNQAGALFVADEVQVGFGRVGDRFWGFDSAGVVPDIVTLGKPIGNGHPLAAVVTTREVAEAFDNGMEYFNTFGGNPVSCAVGMAVLDVIELEDLQKNAREMGELLLEKLRKLKAKYPIIGDVRGRGLFLGVELVKDRQTLEPAAEEAGKIVQAMRHRGILLSTDGPLHNVLKIKPPLVITSEDVERFIQELDLILTER